jgi:23S rRNA (uracil1939-C5)-methyltransferase
LPAAGIDAERSRRSHALSILARVSELVATIESLAYGIFGVARTPQGVVLVPGTAPGDVARVRIVADKRDHREAEVLEILEPSPERRTPPCPYVPQCGGCDWQHVTRRAQLEAKERIVRDALVRIGGFDPEVLNVRPIVPCAEWGYRHRLSLRVDGEQRLGFYQHRSHQLVEVTACRIADSAVNLHLSAARDWLRGTSTEIRRLEIASARDARVAFVGNAEGPFRHDGAYHEKFLRAHPTVNGIVLFGKGWRRAFGDPLADLEVEDGLVLESQGGFTQVNPEGNLRLVEIVVELAAVTVADRVLDLYCGGGNFTLPLARRAAIVLGIESDPASVTQARRNADRAGLGNCRFIQQDAASAARGLAAGGERYSLVLLDPPRSGAASLVDHLPALVAQRLIYVSCNPTTLARDLRRLTAHGFAVGAVQPIDLFAQTHHVETVVHLDRQRPGDGRAAAG